MKLATRTVALNPLLVKELRGRMRGPRAFVFLTGVLVLLGLVSYGLYQLAMPRYYGTYYEPNLAAGAVIGQSVFVGLVFVTLLLICAIAPSLTAGAISGELQRKTFDLLMATPLSAFSILFGKLGAALGYIALILLAALPMTSLAYVFGGVTVGDLVKAFGVMAGFAIAFGVMGLFFSALFRRTGLAVGASYFLLGLATLGTFFVYAVVGVMSGQQPPNWLLALNPFSAMASALVDGVVTSSNGLFGGGSTVTAMLWGLSGGSFDTNAPPQIPLWQLTLVLYTWLTVLWFALATQLIQPARRFRFGFWMWLIVGLVGFGLLVGAIAIFAPGTFSPLRSALRWTMDSEHGVVVNGNFDASLADWQLDPANGTAGTSGASSPPIALVAGDGKKVLELGGALENELSTQTVRQKLQVPLPDAGIVRLHLRLRLGEHATPVCGAKGENCPLTLQLRYTDRKGTEHAWTQGFYVTGQIDRRTGITPRCQTCEGSALHLKVPQDQWYTFTTGDLFVRNMGQDAPQALNELVLRASGTLYHVEVSRVQVLVRQGRPLVYGKPPDGSYVWSPETLVPSFLWNLVNGTPLIRSRYGVMPGRIIVTQPVLMPTRAPIPLQIPVTSVP